VNGLEVFQPMSTRSYPSEVLSVRQAADLLGVNPKTVHALLTPGLPHQRLGPKPVIRIRRDDLLAWGRTTAT
jgi:excisionase family DNA binding protein